MKVGGTIIFVPPKHSRRRRNTRLKKTWETTAIGRTIITAWLGKHQHITV